MHKALLLPGAYLLYVHFSRPKWIDDLLLRTYGPDHLEDGRKHPLEASIASTYGLPIQWVVALKAKGIPDELLDEYSEAVMAKIIQLGPPPNSSPHTLALYKAQVLSATPQKH